MGKLGNVAPDDELPEKVADCITNPEEMRRQEEEVQKLREEVGTLKAELFAVREEMAATWEMATETHKVAERIAATFGESGTTACKAKLYDEAV